MLIAGVQGYEGSVSWEFSDPCWEFYNNIENKTLRIPDLRCYEGNIQNVNRQGGDSAYVGYCKAGFTLVWGSETNPYYYRCIDEDLIVQQVAPYKISKRTILFYQNFLSKLTDNERFIIWFWHHNNPLATEGITTSSYSESHTEYYKTRSESQHYIMKLAIHYGTDDNCADNEQFYYEFWLCLTPYNYEVMTYRNWCNDKTYRWIPEIDFDPHKLATGICKNGYNEVVRP